MWKQKLLRLSDCGGHINALLSGTETWHTILRSKNAKRFVSVLSNLLNEVAVRQSESNVSHTLVTPSH